MHDFSQQDRRTSRGFQHALDIVAEKQVEFDSRQLLRFKDDMLHLTAGYEQNVIQQPPTDLLRFLTPHRHGVDRPVDALDRDCAGFDDALLFQPQVRLAEPANFAGYTNVKLPLAMSSDVTQTIGGHAGFDRMRLPQLLESVIGNQWHVPHSENRFDHQNTNDSIAQLAPRYTMLLNDEKRPAVLEHLGGASGDKFTRPLADNQTSDQMHVQSEANSDKRQLLSDVFQDGGKNRDLRSLRVPYNGSLAEEVISSELAVGRALYAPVIGSDTMHIGPLIAQGDNRMISANSPADFDRDGRSKIDGGSFSDAATNHSVTDALAAMTEKVERLAAAVSRTIHELESARESVQPALPALPRNFGFFRLS